MNKKKLFFTAVANATPYDCIYNKKEFERVALNNPAFIKEFAEQVTDELISKAEEKGWYFILDVCSGHRNVFPHLDKINVHFVGPESLPTISITQYK